MPAKTPTGPLSAVPLVLIIGLCLGGLLGPGRAPAAAETPPTPATAPLLLTDEASCTLQQPTLLELADGSLITLWVTDDRTTVTARRIPSTGLPVDAPLPAAGVLVTGREISMPRLLPGPPGSFHLLWHDDEAGDGPVVKARRFTADLEARGLQREVVPADTVSALDASVAPDGTLAVAFRNPEGLWLSLADDRARPLAEPVLVASTTELASEGGLPGDPVETFTREVRVVSDGGPGWLVAAVECRSSGGACIALARRFDALGAPLADFQTLLRRETLDHLAIAARFQRAVVVVRGSHVVPITGSPRFVVLFAQSLDPEGLPTGYLHEVDGMTWFPGIETPGPAPRNPAVALRPDGSFLVTWEMAPEDAESFHPIESRIRWLAPEGSLRPAIPLAPPVEDQQRSPAVTVVGGTGFAVAWEERPLFPPILPPECPQPSRSFVRRFAACVEDETTLCIGGRFAVEVDWMDPRSLEAGSGHRRPLRRDTGAFWFFDPANLEMMVKVLDGTVVNDHFWLFTGSLTDLELDLRVVDTATGAERTFRRQSDDGTGVVDTGLFPALHPPPTADDSRFPPPASPELQSLPLAQGRFRVEVSWRDPRTGDTGSGIGFPLTDDTGTFWFFDRQNLEMMIKVLDGRLVNQRFWVFWSALTDLELEIRVEDLQAGTERVYEKPAGELGGRLDTAFPLEP